MVIVRRLLGLRADAGSDDIRAFFHGLHIPEGGVHIIGGRKGEAFIIFTSEKDGKLAMERSGELLRGSSVTLEISSLADLKHTIELRLRKQRNPDVENKNSEAEKRRKMEKMEEKKRAELKMRKLELEKKALVPQPPPEPEPELAKSPTDLGTALLLGLVAALQGIQTNNNNNNSSSITSTINNKNNNYQHHQEECQSKSLPVSRLGTHQLPASPEPYESGNHTNRRVMSAHDAHTRTTTNNKNNTNKLQERVPQHVHKHNNIKEVHEGSKMETNVCELGYLRLYGLPNNVTIKDVSQFLQGLTVMDFIPNVYLARGQCCLVKVASLEQAQQGLKYNHMNYRDTCVEVRTACKRMWTHAIELNEQENGHCSTTFSDLDRLSPDSCSSWTPSVKRRSEDRSLSGSPKRQRFDCPPSGQVHCVMVRNLYPKTNKTEIKRLFCCTHIPNHKIIHLLNCWGERTSTAFIMFTHPEDYAVAMNMDGTPNGSKVLDVSSITMEKMWDIISKERQKEAPRPAHYREQNWTQQSYVYARNFPADVRRSEVRDFFCLYQIDENDVTLLKDEKGNGIGEAVVDFRSEQTAGDARSLHGNTFLGQKIMLTCISPEQMRTILQEPR